MYEGIISVVVTRMGAVRFGSSSLNRIVRVVAPRDSAASTNSRSRSEIVRPRTSLAR